MKQNNKDKVFKFLEKNYPKKFSIRKIHQNTKMAYQTAQRIVDVLKAEGKVIVEDLGNTKLVQLNKEGKTNG